MDAFKITIFVSQPNPDSLEREQSAEDVIIHHARTDEQDHQAISCLDNIVDIHLAEEDFEVWDG